MLRRSIIWILVLSSLAGNRCAREVFIDIPEEDPRIVAISHFTDGQPFRVEVSLSRPLYATGEEEVPEVVDVTVSTSGQFLDKLRKRTGDDERIYWESRDTIQKNIQYSLVVRIPGMPIAESTSIVPLHAGLKPIQVFQTNVQTVELDDGSMALRVPLVLEVGDMPEENRFFAFNLRHETEVFEVFNGQIIPDYTYESNSFFLADGRTLSLLHNIPEPVVLINEKFWSEDRTSLLLDALIPFDPATERPLRIFLEWRTLSEEFYRYHLSLARQGSNLPLSDPDAVYNNIVNGYGNFSGYSVSMDTIQLPN
ncbi:MAG: DUF4249 family protein [Saprospiraceae bacterium]